jgi:DNA-binding GntR family transcriptional regulator
MKMKSYSFTPAVRLSLRFALALDWRHFEQFTALRNHIETAFWDEACALLTPDDLALMRRQVESALVKLEGEHVRIPNEEHRVFHMTVFSRLNNPFVTGLLEAYWDAYEAVEVHRYHDYDDLLKVWDYHGQILAALEADDIAEAKKLFVEHTQLIRFKPEHRANGAPSAAHIHKQPNV